MGRQEQQQLWGANVQIINMGFLLVEFHQKEPFAAKHRVNGFHHNGNGNLREFPDGNHPKQKGFKKPLIGVDGG